MLTQPPFPSHCLTASQALRSGSQPNAAPQTLLEQIDLVGAPMTFARNAEISWREGAGRLRLQGPQRHGAHLQDLR